MLTPTDNSLAPLESPPQLQNKSIFNVPSHLKAFSSFPPDPLPNSNSEKTSLQQHVFTFVTPDTLIDQEVVQPQCMDETSAIVPPRLPLSCGVGFEVTSSKRKKSDEEANITAEVTQKIRGAKKQRAHDPSQQTKDQAGSLSIQEEKESVYDRTLRIIEEKCVNTLNLLTHCSEIQNSLEAQTAAGELSPEKILELLQKTRSLRALSSKASASMKDTLKIFKHPPSRDF
ncbi:hypothetical protein PHSC3_001114 [Chlamydiales bacterium STE3]|nr:hypothetical protein PHSC3_001114 [Chlamydiales bacterium STE3]